MFCKPKDVSACQKWLTRHQFTVFADGMAYAKTLSKKRLDLLKEQKEGQCIQNQVTPEEGGL